MQSFDLLSIAAHTQDFILHIRRSLHEIPELGWQEVKTLAFLKKEIEKLQLSSKFPFLLSEKKGGLVVDIPHLDSKQTILFRADVDGLPITEKTDLPFSSKHPGKMHACGHDFHSAMLLGALKLIAEGKLFPASHLRLVWQQAEEMGTSFSGGQALVEKGEVLKGVDYCYALHIAAQEELGMFLSRPGPMFSQPGHLEIKVECSGGHVAHPEVGSNAIDLLVDIQNSLRGFEIRTLGPNEPVSFIPSILKTGEGCNIRPSEGEIWFSLRNFLSEQKLEMFLEALKKRLLALVSGYKQARLSRFIYYPGYPLLCNDETSYAFVESHLKEHGFKTEKAPPLFAGEDFSYFLQKCPGSYWCLGAAGQEIADHHTPTFNPDESVLWRGVAFWALLATTSHPIIKKEEKASLELMHL
ncbi:MAG: amidohydrolase [Simkania negevensis]|nr:amidohydrolase [Simkania negevensis]